MTFVNLLKRKRDRVGLEPVFDFQWHPLKNKTHLICDFVPSWDVQFGKIQKLTVTQLLRYDTIGKIELIPSIVLSSDNTNYKNDIQLFHQLFDELSVYRDYH